jgi:hypothetical protein
MTRRKALQDLLAAEPRTASSLARPGLVEPLQEGDDGKRVGAVPASAAQEPGSTLVWGESQ